MGQTRRAAKKNRTQNRTPKKKRRMVAGGSLIVLTPKGSKRELDDERTLSRLISKEVPDTLPRGEVASAQSAIAIENIIRNAFKKKTYSPSVNERLSLISDGKVHNLFGCQDVDELMNDGVPSIKVDGVCLHYIKEEARALLLSNLEASREVKCSRIITPRQAQSNCWFNTLFVMFFISDKGRKFFKYFRAMMIMGVKGDLIKNRGTVEAMDSLREKDRNQRDVLPREIHKSLFLLNLAIEACLTGNKYAYSLNTNDIILEIHSAIANAPGGAKHIKNVYKPGDSGNPFQYYFAIMSYLSDGTIRILNLNIFDDEGDEYVEGVKDDIAQEIARRRPPHIILVNTRRNRDERVHLMHPKEYNVNGFKYALDAALMMNNNDEHWTCLLTCNEKGYAYDGESYTRLIEFDWMKHALNTRTEYCFEKYIDEKYTFEGPAQTLIYYRIK